MSHCRTFFFLQVEDAIQTSPCGEKQHLVFRLFVFILFFSCAFQLYISAVGPPAGDKIFTFSHTPTPLAPAVKFFVLPPGNKSSLLLPLTPPSDRHLIYFCVLPPSNKVFTPSSTNPPPPPPTDTYSFFFFCAPFL